MLTVEASDEQGFWWRLNPYLAESFAVRSAKVSRNSTESSSGVSTNLDSGWKSAKLSVHV